MIINVLFLRFLCCHIFGHAENPLYQTSKIWTAEEFIFTRPVNRQDCYLAQSVSFWLSAWVFALATVDMAAFVLTLLAAALLKLAYFAFVFRGAQWKSFLFFLLTFIVMSEFSFVVDEDFLFLRSNCVFAVLLVAIFSLMAWFYGRRRFLLLAIE
ncbi:MAG: hypothetical protein PHV34_24730 [Verrucomicrobiae bacterium]|nr:hypothetical protein [Verrucomicrobiae bacterium]